MFDQGAHAWHHDSDSDNEASWDLDSVHRIGYCASHPELIHGTVVKVDFGRVGTMPGFSNLLHGLGLGSAGLDVPEAPTQGGKQGNEGVHS
jgi:hypothetical protein